MSTEWPETTADRLARKARIQKQKQKHREPMEIDTRTPSGKPLAY